MAPLSKNSATGTRTRVARVRAAYPNQLDYSGSGQIEKKYPNLLDKSVMAFHDPCFGKPARGPGFNSWSSPCYFEKVFAKRGIVWCSMMVALTRPAGSASAACQAGVVITSECTGFPLFDITAIIHCCAYSAAVARHRHSSSCSRLRLLYHGVACPLLQILLSGSPAPIAGERPQPQIPWSVCPSG